jgi:heat-inducible transcriptional repressor
MTREPQSQEELDRITSVLNTRLVGRDAFGVDVVRRQLEESSDVAPVVPAIVERVGRLMRDFDASSVEDVFSEGILNVMEAPEFSQAEKLRRVFGVLQDREYLGRLVRDVAHAGRVRVFIGAENGPTEMHDVSLILAPYGRPGRATGVVGVLGPTRLAYPQAISTVRYVSGLMNELVDHLYA